jgi:hypothetical protein
MTWLRSSTRPDPLRGPREVSDRPAKRSVVQSLPEDRWAQAGTRTTQDGRDQCRGRLARMAFKARPVTKDRWSDLVKLFDRPIVRTCSCMFYRKTGTGTGVGLKNRRAMKDLVDQGLVPGLIGYEDGIPVAWATRGLREAPPVSGDETRGRPDRVVDRLFLRGPRRSRPGAVEADARGGHRLCTLLWCPARRGLSSRQGRTKRLGRHVLRREVDVPPRRVPRSGTTQADPPRGGQGNSPCERGEAIVIRRATSAQGPQ